MTYVEALSGCTHAVEGINRFTIFEKHELASCFFASFLYFMYSPSESNHYKDTVSHKMFKITWLNNHGLRDIYVIRENMTR